MPSYKNIFVIPVADFTTCVDFRRAFDGIAHKKLWDSLQRKDINKIKQMYELFEIDVRIVGLNPV